MSLKHELRKTLWRSGYDIERFAPDCHPLARRKALLDNYGVETILDIGANTGQYAIQLRKDLGFRGSIISFEPLSAAFTVLKSHADKDPDWTAFNVALGDEETTTEINLAGNSQSSSLLEMLPAHSRSAPDSVYRGREAVTIRKLDAMFSDLCGSKENIYMKIDTQGFENRVLKGAETSLKSIDTIQMEMSLVPLYKGELLFHELLELMLDQSYTLVALEPGFSDKTSGQLLQVDGIFHRFREKP